MPREDEFDDLLRRAYLSDKSTVERELLLVNTRPRDTLPVFTPQAPLPPDPSWKELERSRRQVSEVRRLQEQLAVLEAERDYWKALCHIFIVENGGWVTVVRELLEKAKEWLVAYPLQRVKIPGTKTEPVDRTFIYAKGMVTRDYPDEFLCYTNEPVQRKLTRDDEPVLKREEGPVVPVYRGREAREL